MAKDGKKAAIVGGAVAVGIGIALLITGRKPSNGEPPPPPPPGLANLYGVVVDSITSEPISGVTVKLLAIETTTNTAGYYLFSDLELGHQTVIFEKEGYVSDLGDIELLEGNNELNFALESLTPPPPPFEGFSLMITNPPAGTTYWAIEQGIFSLNEAAWWTVTPAPWHIHIVFLNSSYECPSGDPGCEGVECYFAPEDGHHYLLDVSTCQKTENPNPPSGPPPEPTDPSVVSVNIPPTQAGGGFTPRIQLYLPDPGGTSYMFTMSIQGKAFRTVEFLPPAFIGHLQDSSQYQPLDNPDGLYEIAGCLVYVGEWPEGGYTFAECPAACGNHSCGEEGDAWLPPGVYPVSASIRTSHVFMSEGEMYYTVPQFNYDLGEIGVLVVEQGAWLEISNFSYPSSVREGGSVTLAVDVTNSGSVAATPEVQFRTGYVEEGGGYSHSETATVNPGQTKRVSWTFSMPRDCPFNSFRVYVEIEGVGELRGKVNVLD